MIYFYERRNDFSLDLNNPHIPRIKSELQIFDPTALPIDISALPFNAAVILTAASGAEVPNATMVRPIIKDGIPNAFAISSTDSLGW